MHLFYFILPTIKLIFKPNKPFSNFPDQVKRET